MRLITLTPDVTWRSLWHKVWYENYPEPAYVWQSTSGEDSYQAKFSLMPVIFRRSFKAASYAMLFAIPLALAGAIYTAYFMSPGLRRAIKPAIEVMGALPTVVIGLVAGIWLAPVIEHYLLAVLSLPVLLAVAVLACGALVNRFAPRRLPPGFDLLILLPLILLVIWLAFSLGPWLEVRLFGEPLHFWLGDDYDQRNALVVDVAMGFALVPIIFFTGGRRLVQRTGDPQPGIAGVGGDPVANRDAGGAAFGQRRYFLGADDRFWSGGGRDHDCVDGYRQYADYRRQPVPGPACSGGQYRDRNARGGSR